VLHTNGNGAQLQFRVVREIHEWNGWVVGIARNSLGAEFVVRQNLTAGRWDVLSGISRSDLHLEEK